MIQSFFNDFTPEIFILPLSWRMFHDKGPKHDFFNRDKSQVSSGNCCLINNTARAGETSWNFGDFEITITVKCNLLCLYNSKLGYLDASVFQFFSATKKLDLANSIKKYLTFSTTVDLSVLVGFWFSLVFGSWGCFWIYACHFSYFPLINESFWF